MGKDFSDDWRDLGVSKKTLELMEGMDPYLSDAPPFTAEEHFKMTRYVGPVPLKTGVISQDWMDDASCKGLPPEMFMIERGETSDEAKAVCASCIVWKECETFAVVNRIEEGVWGGTIDQERRKIRKRNKKNL